MAIYHLPDSAVNTTAIPITGRYLAHTHSSPIERAFLAADLYTGVTHLVNPTMTQSAHLSRVNVTYGWLATKRLAERTAIEGGMIPLVPPHLAVPKTNGKALPALPASLDAPVDAWALAKSLVETFGPAVVFDTVIAPAIT